MEETVADYLKPAEFAKKFNLSQSTVNKWIRAGRINAIVIRHLTKNHYRIPVSEIERFEKELLNGVANEN